MATLKPCKSSFYRKQNHFLHSRNKKKVKFSVFINLLKLALKDLNWILIGDETEKTQICLPFPGLESSIYSLQSYNRDNTQIDKHTKLTFKSRNNLATELANSLWNFHPGGGYTQSDSNT